MTLTAEQGRDIVKYARSVIELSFKKLRPETPRILMEAFKEDRGVFVTLHTHPKHDLRGCIGYAEPIMPLGKATMQAAIAAAFEDPRFPAVEEKELDNLIVEVSVLTKPELVNVKEPRDYKKEIKVGRDGLIVEKGWCKGLLLPQVPVELEWDCEEFLCETCGKAGLPADAWLSKDTKVYKYSAQVFSETKPRGEVVEKKIGVC